MISTALDLAYWLAVSAVIGVPLFAALYILVTPRRLLVEQFQNYRLRRTQRALKDHHFRSLPRQILIAKLLSPLVIALCLITLGLLIYGIVQDHQTALIPQDY